MMLIASAAAALDVVMLLANTPPTSVELGSKQQPALYDTPTLLHQNRKHTSQAKTDK